MSYMLSLQRFDSFIIWIVSHYSKYLQYSTNMKLNQKRNIKYHVYLKHNNIFKNIKNSRITINVYMSPKT